MKLTLEVTGAQAKELGSSSRKTFSEAGGTIGRGAGKRGVDHWLLPHDYVSSLHAEITFADGVFYIEDRSRNGVFINSADKRIETGRKCAIKSGDSILIDPFNIRASLSGEQPVTGRSHRPLETSPGWERDLPLPDPLSGAPRAAPVYPDEMPSVVSGGDVLNFLGPKQESRAEPVPNATDLERNSFLHDRIPSPKSKIEADADAPTGPLLIPEDYNPIDDSVLVPPSPAPDPFKSRPKPADSAVEQKRPSEARRSSPGASSVRPSRPAPEPSPPPAPEVPRRKDAGGDVASILAGAGLTDVHPTPELARNLGEIFRTVVEGVMDVLQARQELKSELALEQTRFGRDQNNPLKFSANVEDALHNLLVKRNPAYLGPVDAFEDAFDDLRNHQIAMLAGMRAAFDAMLAEFEPDRLEERFNRRVKGALVAVPNKFRYWDLYRERFDDMVRDADATFSKLFREEFAGAYEAQLERLKAQGRGRKP